MSRQEIENTLYDALLPILTDTPPVVCGAIGVKLRTIFDVAGAAKLITGDDARVLERKARLETAALEMLRDLCENIQAWSDTGNFDLMNR